MTLRNFLVAAALSFAVSTNAFAEEETTMIEIAETGLQSLDDVFSPVSGIHTQLTDAQTSLNDIETNLNTALGVSEDAPLATALANLKEQAGDALSFEMDGTTPKLSVAEGAEVPENVTAGIAALQTAFADLGTLTAGLQELPAKVGEISTAAQELIGNVKGLKTEAKDAGIKGKAFLDVVKTSKSNLSATKQTTEHISNTVGAATSLLDTLTAPFKG
jgi:hypothetical protein